MAVSSAVRMASLASKSCWRVCRSWSREASNRALTAAASGIKAGAYVQTEYDQHGNATQYNYDLQSGQLQSVQTADGTTTSYSYVENTSFTVNNSYTVNTVVHYFDETHTEREAVIPTCFEKGSSKMLPIGMTVDIYCYRDKYDYDPKSVRSEYLPGEEELMDDKPVDPMQLKMVAVSCPNCGSSFQAATGYSSKCPYCGSYINA